MLYAIKRDIFVSCFFWYVLVNARFPVNVESDKRDEKNTGAIIAQKPPLRKVFCLFTLPFAFLLFLNSAPLPAMAKRYSETQLFQVTLSNFSAINLPIKDIISRKADAFVRPGSLHLVET